MVKLSLPQPPALSWLLPQRMTLFPLVFIFISLSSYTASSTYFSSSSGRYGRQLGYGGNGGGLGERRGGGGGGGGYGFFQPYNRQRQQSLEANLFQTMMSLNFDPTEVVAMYRNVTAVAETPGCSGHCRTPMALWVVQSFYPCYNLQKVDCPKGLVCCMGDPASTRLVGSANTLQDSRVKARPSLVESLSGSSKPGPGGQNNKDSYVGGTAPVPVSSSPSDSPSPTPHQPSQQSTTLFDEEYFKNNFIQDEIPE